MDNSRWKWMKWMDRKKNRAHSQKTNGPIVQIMSKRDLKRSLNLSSSFGNKYHHHPTACGQTQS